MEYLERNPLPQECLNCTDVECDVCDNGLDRWYIPHDLELRIQKKSLLKALDREKQRDNETGWIEDRIKEIDQQLLPFTEAQMEAIEHKVQMSREIFEKCISICVQAGDLEMQDALYQYFPQFKN